MKYAKLIAVASIALVAMLSAALAATLVSETKVEKIVRNADGAYTITVGGQDEPLPVDGFCRQGYQAAGFRSENHDLSIRVTVSDGMIKIDDLSVKLVCPPPFDTVAMRTALVADLATRDYVQKEHVTAMLAAYDAGDFKVVDAVVEYPGNRIIVNGESYETLDSPYAPRLSEGNFFLGHLRDEYLNGTKVLIIEAESLRFTVLWSNCGKAIEIEKLAIGRQVTMQVVTESVPQVVQKKTTTRTGRWVYQRFELTVRPNNHRWSKAVWAKLRSTQVEHTVWGYGFFGPNERGWCRGGNNQSYNGRPPSGTRDRYCWGERRVWVTN